MINIKRFFFLIHADLDNIVWKVCSRSVSEDKWSNREMTEMPNWQISRHIKDKSSRQIIFCFDQVKGFIDMSDQGIYHILDHNWQGNVQVLYKDFFTIYVMKGSMSPKQKAQTIH